MLKHIKLYFSFKEYFEETPEIKIVQSCKNIDIKDGGDAGGVGEVVLVGSRVRLCSLGSPCHGASLSCDQIASERKPEIILGTVKPEEVCISPGLWEEV